MKKFILIALSLIVLFSFAYAATKKSNVTLTFAGHNAGIPISGVDQKIAKMFEEETGIKIDFQVIPDAQWRDLLKVKLASGEAPDVFLADADPFSLNDRIHPEQNCIDLSKEEWNKRLDPQFISSISYKGKIYGLSIFPGVKTWIFFYNKKIFEKLNLKVPKNYNEFKNVCQTIKNSGTTPIYECLSDGWHQVLPLFEIGEWYAKFHPGLYDQLNNNKIKVVDIPEMETTLKQIKEFADLGLYDKDFITNRYDDRFKALAEGKVAMCLDGMGTQQQYEALYPGKGNDLGFFIMPWCDNQLLNVNPAGNARFGNKKSKYQKEILQYFKFLTRHDILQKRQDLDPGTLMLNWPEIKPKMPKEYQDLYNPKINKQGLVMQYGVKYIDSQWMDVGKDIEAMYVGSLTPKQVLENIDKRRSEQASLQKDPAWAK